MTELDTFNGWQAQGRSIARGHKAKHYGKIGDGSWVALFSEDQTEPRSHVTIDDVLETRTTEEHKESKKDPSDPRPKVIVTAYDGWVRIWVGSNEKGLRMVKRGGYRFNARTHRWEAQKDIDPVVQGLNAAGFNVSLNGNPYNPMNAVI